VADQREVLRRRQVGVQVRLFGYVADSPLTANRILGHADAVEMEQSGARLEEADDHVDGRALTRSIRPQVAEDFPAADLEADLVDREKAAVPPREPPRLKHAGPGWSAWAPAARNRRGKESRSPPETSPASPEKTT